MNCPWCANPESQSYTYETMEYPSRCVECGLCITRCPQKAILDSGQILRAECKKKCTECTDICYAQAKKLVGKEYSIDELFHEIKKDKVFYDIKGGGVTFSGGEPLTFGKYLKEISKKCQNNGIDVCIESCGYGNYDDFKDALEYINSMFIDIKIMDTDKHKEIVGINNEIILGNIMKISECGIPLIIRTPVVPGYTDSDDNISRIAEFVSKIPTATEYELLVYHNLGESKYTSLGRKYSLKGLDPPSEERMRELVKIANDILKKNGKSCFFMKDNNKEVI